MEGKGRRRGGKEGRGVGGEGRGGRRERSSKKGTNTPNKTKRRNHLFDFFDKKGEEKGRETQKNNTKK